MRATIRSVDQKYSFEAKAFSNFMTLELPSGLVFQVPIDDATLASVIQESEEEKQYMEQHHPGVTVHQPEPRPKPPPPDDVFDPTFLATVNAPVETPVERRPQLQHHVETGVIDWETLPDTQLPPSMKHIMRTSGMNQYISIEDLDKVKLAIAQRLSIQPKAGKVDWNGGARRQVETAPRRMVKMDDAGNPMPPGGILEMPTEKDPGEVRDDDDDGVEQA